METFQCEGDNISAGKTLELLSPNSSIINWSMYMIVTLEIIGLAGTGAMTCGSTGISAGGGVVHATRTTLHYFRVCGVVTHGTGVGKKYTDTATTLDMG